MLTTPQPTWVQGATGDIGVVPEVGSQVEKLGYHADWFRACLMSALVICKSLLLTNKPFLAYSLDAPDSMSPASSLSMVITRLRIPAVRGVANEVPEVTW